jgi:hypothetical protein
MNRETRIQHLASDLALCLDVRCTKSHKDVAEHFVNLGWSREQDIVLDIYRMLWEEEIKYINNGESGKSDAIWHIRQLIKLKYDAKDVKELL